MNYNSGKIRNICQPSGMEQKKSGINPDSFIKCQIDFLNLFKITYIDIQCPGNFPDIFRINYSANADQCIIVAANYQ